MAIGRRAFVASGLAAMASPAVARGAAGALPQVTLRLHHAASSVSCTHVNFLAPWARQVETQTGGRIRIEIFPSMQLGGQPAELFDQVCERTADLVVVMPSSTPGRFPKIETFELPFVPSARALVSSKALQDFAAEHLADEFRAVHPICFCCADRGVLHAPRPVPTLAELKDMRLDAPTRFAAASLQALGARPVPVPPGQLAYAVRSGVLDGCLVAWDMVPPLKLDSLLKAHTDFADWSLGTATFALLMNKPAYEKLPADLKKVLDDNSGQLAAGMAGSMWDLQASLVAAAADRRGEVMTTLGPDMLAPWRKATEPVIAAFVGEMKSRKVDGMKLIAGARTLLAKYAGEPEPQPLPRPVQASPSSATETGSVPPPKPAAPAAPAGTANAAPAPSPAPKVAPSPKFTIRARPSPGSTSTAAAPPVPPNPSAIAAPSPAHPPVAAPAAKVAPAVAAPPTTLDIPL